MPGPALTPQAAVERLDASSEVRAALLLDEHGELTAGAGAEPEELGRMRALAVRLFAAADAAGERAGVEQVARVEVSRPDGGVFGLRERDRADRLWTLVAVTAAGALAALVLHDLRMTLLAMEPTG